MRAFVWRSLDWIIPSSTADLWRAADSQHGEIQATMADRNLRALDPFDQLVVGMRSFSSSTPA